MALEEGDEAPVHFWPEPRRLVDLLDGSGFCLFCQQSLSIGVEDKQIPVQNCRPDRTNPEGPRANRLGAHQIRTWVYLRVPSGNLGLP